MSNTKKLLKFIFVILFLPFFVACAFSPNLPKMSQGISSPEKKALLSQNKPLPQIAYKDFLMACITVSRGQYNKAHKYLLQSLEKDPNSVYLNQKMAVLLKNLKDTPAALKYAQKCVGLEPDNAVNYILLGDLYILQKDKDLSLIYYNKALNITPKNQQLRLIITNILIKKELFVKALTHLEILIQENPNLIMAYYYRGRIELSRKQYGKAEESFKKALSLNNENMEPALFDLGTLYHMTSRYMDAIKIYENLINYYPYNFAARERLLKLYLNLGQNSKADQQIAEIKRHSRPGEPGRKIIGSIYLKQGKLNQAIYELDLVVTAWPNDYQSRYYLAAAYQAKGDLEKALEHFYIIKQESKYYYNARMNIAHILEIQGKADTAIIILEQIINQGKKAIPEINLMLASIYEMQENYQKAIEVIKEGVRQNKGNIELLFRLGILIDKTGDNISSIKYMEKILEIDPNHAESLNYIGYSLAEQDHNLDKAIQLIQKALKIKPDSPYIIDSLGWVYFRKEHYKEALTYLKKATQLLPDDPTINEHLGDAYVKMKDYYNALKHYKKVLLNKDILLDVIKNKIRNLEQLMGKKH